MRIEDMVFNEASLSKYPIVGIEKEGWVTGPNGTPINLGAKNVTLIKDIHEKEFGRDQIEFQTYPEKITYLAKIQEELSEVIDRFKRNNPELKVHFKPIRDNLAIEDILVNDSNFRYQQLSEKLAELHKGKENKLGNINFTDLTIMALFNSTQTNIRMNSKEEAISYLNAGIMMSPELTALSGEPSSINGEETGWYNFRLLGWHKMLKQEKWLNAYRAKRPLRVGIPTTYFDSFEHYIEHIKPIVPILNPTSDDMLEKIKNLWFGTRIKFKPTLDKNNPEKYDLVVEFRDPGSMHTIEEDVAIVAYALGRSKYISDEVSNEKMNLIDLPNVYKNFLNASSVGLNYAKSNHFLRQEIETAMIGLESLGYKKNEIITAIDPLILKAKEYEKRKAS